MKTYLRIGDEPLEEATKYKSRDAAIREYFRIAKELWRYGQKCEGALYDVARSYDGPYEYPAYLLSLGPKGGLVVERNR